MGIANQNQSNSKHWEYQSPNSNQIDYICIKDNPKGSLYNSRSNGRM